MSLATNKDVYTTVEFDQWVDREELLPEEKILVEKYIPKAGPTIEAGTGGGRIIRVMKSLGYDQLHAFDFVPEFVEACRKRTPDGSIQYRVGDMKHLEYGDQTFANIIYLQQVICLLENSTERRQALLEAGRIIRPGGKAAFSFLSWEARTAGAAYNAYLAYLRILRAVTFSRRAIQTLPWLKLGAKFNWGSLLDRGPYVYWYKTPEVCEFLESGGFTVDAIGTTRQILEGRFCKTPAEMHGLPHEGNLYVACTKR